VTVTQTGQRELCIANNALTTKRNMQTLELFIVKIDFGAKKEKGLTLPRFIEKSLFSKHEYDSKINSLDDASSWIKAAESQAAESFVWAILDGVEYRLFDFLNWKETFVAIYAVLNVCQKCNRLLFWTYEKAFETVPSDCATAYHKGSDRYCSSDCRKQYNQAKHSLLRKETRLAAKVTIKKHCTECGCEFEAKRDTAKFCSTKCRVYAHRNRGDHE
jgi:hypothetical protein